MCAFAGPIRRIRARLSGRRAWDGADSGMQFALGDNMSISIPTPADRSADRLGLYGAGAATLGVLASGPIAFAVVNTVHPQPPWADARTFAANYHPVQIWPFVCGLMLVCGFAALVTSIHALTPPDRRGASGFALTMVTVFAALIGFNYVVQTTFVPALLRGYQDADAAIVAAFSMAHPGSLAWALEMWGYAFLGAATWLIAPFFTGGRLENFTRWTFVANGPLSIGAALWSVAQPGWEARPAGLVAFVVWNVLALLMAASACWVFRQRLRGYTRGHAARRGMQVSVSSAS